MNEQLPPGLADLPPGPDLAAALAPLDDTRLSGYDAVVSMQAWTRLLAHVTARHLAAVRNVAHCAAPTDDTDPILNEADRSIFVTDYAADEVAAALTWTRRAAQVHIELAEQIGHRLPALHQALLTGHVDLPKVRVIVDAVDTLNDQTARTVIDTVLPTAGRLTTSQLRRKLRRLVLKADPATAAKRRDAAETAREVTHHIADDNTVTITALGLPIPQAARAIRRIEFLALTTKRAGDPRTMDQLRADTYLDLLAGTHTGPDPTPRPGVIDLVVPLTTIANVSDEPGELPGWGPVLADVARQLALDPTGETQWRIKVIDADGKLVAAVPTHRRPTPTQAAHIRARDVECRMVGCQRPAAFDDIDHTTAHHDGGPTLTMNLELLCRHDHVMKHHSGWQLTQPTPGEFIWTSPLGHTYTRGEEHFTAEELTPTRPHPTHTSQTDTDQTGTDQTGTGLAGGGQTGTGLAGPVCWYCLLNTDPLDRPNHTNDPETITSWDPDDTDLLDPFDVLDDTMALLDELNQIDERNLAAELRLAAEPSPVGRQSRVAAMTLVDGTDQAGDTDPRSDAFPVGDADLGSGTDLVGDAARQQAASKRPPTDNRTPPPTKQDTGDDECPF